MLTTPSQRPRANTSNLPLISCGYELDSKGGVSRLCDRKPATHVVHKVGEGNLYLCKRHATPERLLYAIEHGYTVRSV